ncbi:hypothetical protein PAECIP111893_02572 [Paenibacillus plantiphilus]|uniref:ABC transporter substrate-binding protein n=1 Tax=Paenibacillus plantiphilus TaxID=2905650 RepID=A0ABM9C9S1_9BACL|nr:extracellular solute-binding protein [Paenibacillus plantiphilus]CAH1206478.1 hypothetical protein PAECIP111893_02572 [Paenibacillus plantiphilus]
MKKMPLLLLVVILLLAGCQQDKSAQLTVASNKDKVKLRVLHINQTMFNEMYGKEIMKAYPNYEIEVIPMESVFSQPDRSMKEIYEDVSNLIKQEKPDLIIFPFEDVYQKLAAKGELVDLGSYVKTGALQTENLHAPAIEKLTALNKASLNGIPARFDSKGLYYNKQLFDTYNLEYPTEQMSWEEVFALANRFKGKEEGIYGYNPPLYGFLDLFDIIRTVGYGRGLSVLDASETKVALNTDEWKSTTNLVLNGYKEGYLYLPEIPKDADSNGIVSLDPNTPNLFTEGKSAMTVDGIGLSEIMKLQHRNGGAAVEWGVVPEPGNGQSNMMLSDIFTIHVDSSLINESLEVLKYITSDKLSFNMDPEMVVSGISTNTKWIEKTYGEEFNGFFQNKNIAPHRVSSAPEGFWLKFHRLASKEMLSVFTGGKPVNDALEQLQREGQAVLEQE